MSSTKALAQWHYAQDGLVGGRWGVASPVILQPESPDVGWLREAYREWGPLEADASTVEK